MSISHHRRTQLLIERTNNMPMIEANVPVMFDMKTVAKILSVSRSTVYQLLESGELKAVRVGRVRRVSQNQLVEYIMKLEQKEDNWVLSDYSAKRVR
jgi:excisionase family DNA binding protein